MNEKITQLFGFIAQLLCVLFVLISIIIGVLKIIGYPVEVSNEIWFGYLFTTLSFFMSYIYSRVEDVKKVQKEFFDRETPHLEMFETSEELLSRASELTVGAEKVSTINLSEPPEAAGALEKYFKLTHKYLMSRNSPLKSFRTNSSYSHRRKTKVHTANF